MRYHASLAELGVDYSRRFYDEILAKYTASGRAVLKMAAGRAGPLLPRSTGMGQSSPAAATTESHSPKRVTLELHAPVGSVASGAFSLENRRDEPADVSFEVSPWSASDGTPGRRTASAFAPELQIGPRAIGGRDHRRPFGPGRICPRSAVHNQRRGQRL